MHSAYETVMTAASAIIQSVTGGQDQFSKEVGVKGQFRGEVRGRVLQNNHLWATPTSWLTLPA
jgi:hypothetical protein